MNYYPECLTPDLISGDKSCIATYSSGDNFAPKLLTTDKINIVKALHVPSKQAIQTYIIYIDIH